MSIRETSIVVATVAPYNNYTLTCIAVLPDTVTALSFSVFWYDNYSDGPIFPTENIEITNIISGSSATSTLRVLATGDRDNAVLCSAEAYITVLEGDREIVASRFTEESVNITVRGE